MKPLAIYPVQTRILNRGEDLLRFIVEQLPSGLVKENMVLAVTSKIISVAEERFVAYSSIEKKALVEREADAYLGEIGHGCFLTVKSGLLIPSAGIDESNSAQGDYILYPEDPFASAEILWRELRKIWGIKNLGIVVTDSHTTPLRRGVTGICLSYAGFRAVRSLVGTEDLFGRALKVTQINYADGLAGGAVMMMGEGAECRPLAVIDGAELDFCEEIDRAEFLIPLEEDLYFPILRPLLRE